MGLNILNLTKWPRWLYDTKIQDDVEVTLKDHFQCAALVLFNQVRVPCGCVLPALAGLRIP